MANRFGEGTVEVAGWFIVVPRDGGRSGGIGIRTANACEGDF